MHIDNLTVLLNSIAFDLCKLNQSDTWSYEHRGGDEGIDKAINDSIESLLWPDRVDIL
jgi:hypothetical protein